MLLWGGGEGSALLVQVGPGYGGRFGLRGWNQPRHRHPKLSLSAVAVYLRLGCEVTVGPNTGICILLLLLLKLYPPPQITLSVSRLYSRNNAYFFTTGFICIYLFIYST